MNQQPMSKYVYVSVFIRIIINMDVPDEQESRAIARMTMRCAKKFFGSP